MTDSDLLEQLVWAAVAGRAGDELVDEDPADTLDRFRRSLDAGRYPGGLEAVAGELDVDWPPDPLLLTAAAWAGRARWALIRRDAAVRAAVAAGLPKLRVAEAVGLTRPAIDRILDRAGATNTRW